MAAGIIHFSGCRSQGIHAKAERVAKGKRVLVPAFVIVLIGSCDGDLGVATGDPWNEGVGAPEKRGFIGPDGKKATDHQATLQVFNQRIANPDFTNMDITQDIEVLERGFDDLRISFVEVDVAQRSGAKQGNAVPPE